MSNQKVPAKIKSLWNKHQKGRDKKTKLTTKQAMEVLNLEEAQAKAMAALTEKHRIQNCKHDTTNNKLWAELLDTCRELKYPLAALIAAQTPALKIHEPAKQ